MSRDYVKVVPMKGHIYFYLRPPRHLASILPKRIRLYASTREEAARQAAEIVIGAGRCYIVARRRPPLAGATKAQQDAIEKAGDILRAVGLDLIPIRFDPMNGNGSETKLGKPLGTAWQNVDEAAT